MNNNKKPDDNQYSESYLLEKEKIKTRRTRNRYIFFGVIILAAILALYFIVGKGGKGGFNVDLTKGTFSFNVDKPVVEQAKTETKTFESPDGKKIDYTTGTLNKAVLDDFSEENITFYPDAFVGENLINETAGYIISSSYPEIWYVQYDPQGLDDPLIAINTLTANDGSSLTITREPIYYSNIQDHIEASVNTLFEMGIISEYPYVSYADDGKTAFLTFTNPVTNDQSFMKVVQGYSYYYVVNAYYNIDLTNYELQDELAWMVGNFTLIE